MLIGLPPPRSGWYFAQGTAGIIERCARRVPEVEAQFSVVFSKVGYLVLGTLAAAIVSLVAGILTRTDVIPALPSALLLNTLCLTIAVYMALLLRRFVRFIGYRLGDIPEQIPDRFLSARLTVSHIWNWVGVITSLLVGLSTNDAWSISTQSNRINPNLELFLMPILYVGSAYCFYMADIVGMTKYYAVKKAGRIGSDSK